MQTIKLFACLALFVAMIPANGNAQLHPTNPEPRKVLVFDRPLAILLCDTQTSTILFASVVYDPK